MFTCWLSREKAFAANRSCNCIVGVCHSVADAFIRFTQIDDKVKVVYNTLDTDYILDVENRLNNVIESEEAVGAGDRQGYSDFGKKQKELANILKTYFEHLLEI
jgi:hypothetical protein